MWRTLFSDRYDEEAALMAEMSGDKKGATNPSLIGAGYMNALREKKASEKFRTTGASWK